MTKQTRRSLLIGAGAWMATGSWALARQQRAIAQEVVSVNTVEEFVKAIQPNRTLQLAAGEYNLSSLPTDFRTEYVQFNEVFDGHEFVISQVENLKIVGTGDRATKIVTKPRYADVLEFQDCRSIWLENFEATHSPDKGSCVGGVVAYRNCQDLVIRDAILEGSGTIGINGQQINKLFCRNTIITGCTYGILCLSNTEDVTFQDCQFKDNQEFDLVSVFNTKEIRFKDCEFSNNQTGNGGSRPYVLFNVNDSEPLQLLRCKVTNNRVQHLSQSANRLRLIATSIRGNQFDGQRTYPVKDPGPSFPYC
ncbi:MAG TPA: right-handed parallel beta-helix repeat-containing protein [Leptolyngbyaceae cyanobacterium M33_DOE_097]|uniref:Right-handed parallel beta-helix repeat-containing protein n=1 Tax=Oscillatoriales cyanobacterium SpSt-418 TaxID=2282169 RepID=A0A7C3PGL1_9CYAN|nr:right-handed parallel beta-helix repeat-containing protein [Leptolyngbyaceae cyanobacterium M33_DOE_097]